MPIKNKINHIKSKNNNQNKINIKNKLIDKNKQINIKNKINIVDYNRFDFSVLPYFGKILKSMLRKLGLHTICRVPFRIKIIFIEILDITHFFQSIELHMVMLLIGIIVKSFVIREIEKREFVGMLFIQREGNKAITLRKGSLEI